MNKKQVGATYKINKGRKYYEARCPVCRQINRLSTLDKKLGDCSHFKGFTKVGFADVAEFIGA